MVSKCPWQTDETQIDKSSLKDLISSLLVAEEQRWLESGSPLHANSSSSRSRGTPVFTVSQPGPISKDPGWNLLRHGNHVSQIHKYFQNLEPHRYCLSLTARTKNLERPDTRVRLVKSDSRTETPLQNEEGSIGRLDEQERQLNDKDPEFELYEMAIQCSQFPALSAPPTPSPYSPTPLQASAGATSPTRQMVFSFRSPVQTSSSYSLDDASYSPPPLWSSSPFQPPQTTKRRFSASSVRACLSPEPVAPVHSDMLRELVQNVFYLSKRRHLYWEKVVRDKKQPKKPEKLLMEDLQMQLSLLESNHHPFYRVQAFLDKNGYSEWLIAEKEHIHHLMKSFWHFSLPPMPGLPIHIVDAHQKYKTLLAKLIRHESTNKTAHSVFGDYTPTSPPSPASCRLLKEFALRYGVGELYRRLVYLKYMADHFENDVWYIEHVTVVLENVMCLITTTAEIFVKEEFIMLLYILTLLLHLSKYSLTHLIRLFPNNAPPGGVTALVAMAALVHEAAEFLRSTYPAIFLIVREAREFVDGLDDDPFEKQLTKFLKEEMGCRYERYKVIAMVELYGHCYSTPISPQLLNILYLNIRDEVNNYKTYFQQEFERYVDVVELAAITHYQLLMADVQEMCQEPSQDGAVDEVDLRMLSIAFRLSALDQDWAKYISASMQTWRTPFTEFFLTWLDVVGGHVQGLVPILLQKDPWSIAELAEPGTNTHSTKTRKSHPVSVRNRPPSPTRLEITPSERSAFSAPKRCDSDSGLKVKRLTAVPNLMQRQRLTTSHPELSSLLPSKPRKLSQPDLLCPRATTAAMNRDQYSSEEESCQKPHTIVTAAQVHVTRAQLRGRPTRPEEISDTDSSKSGDITKMDFRPTKQKRKWKHKTDIKTAVSRDDSMSNSNSVPSDEELGWHQQADVTRRIETIDRTEKIGQSDELGNAGQFGIAHPRTAAGENVSGCSTPYQNKDSSSSNDNAETDSTHSPDSMDFIEDEMAKQQTLIPVSIPTFEHSKTPIESTAVLAGVEKEQNIDLRTDSSSRKSKLPHVTSTSHTEEGEVGEGNSKPERSKLVTTPSTDVTLETEKERKKERSCAASCYIETGAEASPPSNKRKGPRASRGPCHICQVGEAGACPPEIEQIADMPGNFESSQTSLTETPEHSKGLVCPRVRRLSIPKAKNKFLSTAIETDASSSAGSVPTVYGSCQSGSATDSFTTARDHIRNSSTPENDSSGDVGSESSISSETAISTSPELRTEAQDSDTKTRLLPLSSSVVDLLCCIHRLTAFTCHLCKVLCPHERPAGATGGVAEPPEAREWSLEIKNALCRKLVQILVSVVQLYADNVIGMETCGMRDDELISVLRERMCRRLREEYWAGRLTGCRLDPNATQRCNTTTVTGREVLPCHAIRSVSQGRGGCECITHEMGVRVNDIAILRSLLVWIHGRVTSAISSSDLMTSGFLGNGTDVELSIKSETYCQFGPSLDGHTQGDRQEDCVRVGDANSLGDLVLVDQCVTELERIEMAQTKLLAYRANVYFKQLLHTLLQLSLPSFELKRRLQPAVEFLTRKLTALHRVMFPDCFYVFLRHFWGYIAQDFSEEAQQLKTKRPGAAEHSKLLLQAIAYLMQFFHGQGHGLSLDTLSKSTEHVSKHLELYTSLTLRLIRMYGWFARQMFLMQREHPPDEFTSSISTSSHYSRAHEPADYLIQALRTELHATRKCFSGAQFVDWVKQYVKQHGYDSLGVCIGSSETETGLELGHYLLERNLLVCICSHRKRYSSTLVEDQEEDLDEYEGRGRGSVLVCDQQQQGTMSINEIAVCKQSPNTTHGSSSHPSSSRSASRTDTLSPEVNDGAEECDSRGLVDTMDGIIFQTSQSESTEFYNNPHVFYSFMSDEEGTGGEFKHKLDFMDRFTVGQKLQQILCVLYTRKDEDSRARLFLKGLSTNVVTEALGYEKAPTCFRL